MAKHTPGPWQECDDGNCTCGHVWSIPGDFPVCTVSNENGLSRFTIAVAHEHMADSPELIYATIPKEMVVANAQLIAAAPDLLAALKGMSAAIRECGVFKRGQLYMSDVLEIGDAAIARAEGRKVEE